MRIILDSQIHIFDASVAIKNVIQAHLTIKNPEYDKKNAMGIPVYGIPRVLRLYSIKQGNGTEEIIIPRGYLPELRSLLRTATLTYTDNRLLCNKVQFESSIKLRDYQTPSIDIVKQRRSGVIIMPCGSGKTETGLQIVAELGQPTLWVTHTKDLFNQSLERAKSKLGLSGDQIGVIAGDEFKVGTHMTFGMVQTLANRDLTGIVDKFGCIIVDESHHLFKDHKAVGQFYTVISQFPAVYRIGLTASEHRSDGLIRTMFLTIGPKIYEVTQEELRVTGNVIIPTVEFVPTHFVYEKTTDTLYFSQMLKAMAEDARRNQIIINTILNSQPEAHYGLVLGDSLEHLQTLYNHMSTYTYLKSAYMDGSTPKNERNKILRDMRDRKINLLFATYALAKEGLDVPCLDRLYLTTPKRDKVTIQQSVGRSMRPAPGKTEARVYDFYDCLNYTCCCHAKERVKVYKTLGCEIIGGPVRRNSRFSMNQKFENLNNHLFTELKRLSEGGD